MKRYLLLLIISTVLASCSEYGKKKVIDCNCNSPYRDKYLSYSDGQEVKFSNGTDTISFKTKVVLATSYKDTILRDEKCIACANPCYSYCWLSNDSIDLYLSIIISLENNEIVCAYGNASSDRFNIYRHAIQNLNITDSTLIFTKEFCLIFEYTHSYYFEYILPNIFRGNTYFEKFYKKILNNYDKQDWIESKSAVQSMTITEGVGISRIEFECGEVWTIVQ